MKHLHSVSLKILLAIAVNGVCFTVNAAEVDAVAAKALAKENSCFRCHGVDKDKDGPAFNKIAAKYKGNPDTQSKLLHHLSSGEKAKFPDGHEEAHPILKADPAATKNLVDWILSL